MSSSYYKNRLNDSSWITRIKSMSPSLVDEKLNRVRSVFAGVPIVTGRNNYPYSFFSLTDFDPPMNPHLMEDMADLAIYFGEFHGADVLVSEADRGGGPLTHAIAVRANLPYTLANWYPKEIVGQVSVQASVGFSGTGNVYLNGLSKGDKAIFVDDLLSSGGTAVAVIEAIRLSGADPVEAVFIAEKVGLGGRNRVKEKFDIPITSLVRFAADGKATRLVLEEKDT